MKSQISVLPTIAMSFGLAIFIFGSASARAESIDLASQRIPLSQAKHGRTRVPSFVRVLSFDELMRLPKTKRVAYIRGLRTMMRELDRTSSTASLDGVSRSQIAMLLDMFEPSAEAADAAPGLTVQEGANVSCGKGFTPVHPSSVGYGADHADSDATHYACSVRAARSAEPCPGTTVPLNQDAKTFAFYCVTKSSYGKLNLNQRSNGRAPAVPMIGDAAKSVGMKNFTDPKYESHDQIHKQIEAARVAAPRTTPRSGDALAFKYPAGVKPPTAAPGAGATVPGRLSANNGEAPGKDAPAGKAAAPPPPPPPPPAGKPTTPTAPEPAAPADPGKQKAAPVPANPAPGREEKASTDAPSDVVVAPVGEKPAKAADAAPAPADVKECAPESETPKTCNAAEVETARRKYASDPDKDCIYAGGISTYEGGTKRAYHCLAPRDFCFGSTSCTTDAGEKMKPDYSCAMGQVLCNPLLFGLDSDGKSPICIAKGAHATKSCDDASGDDAVSPLDQKHPGLREAWNDFADRLFTMCHTNQTAAALHCNECDIISKRLFTMNLIARDVKSCGAAMKYEVSNCDADGACSVRPGGGDPDNKGKAAPVKGAGSTGKVTTVPSVWENREPASEKRSWAPGRE